MRSHTLHAPLRAFVEEAGRLLAEDTAGGAEVPFELVEEGARRRTPLYCYRPVVDAFLRERVGALARLDAHGPALRALGEHADALPRYLAALGRRASTDPRVVLEAFLGRVFAEQSDFVLDDGRFARAYAVLEEALFAGRTDATVVVPVAGLALASDTVVLGEGLELRRAGTLAGAPPDAADDEDGVLASFRAVVEDGGPDPFAVAGRRFRRLLSALRLYADGDVALGPLAWVRVDDGPWRSAPLAAGPTPRTLHLVTPGEEDELRAFCALVARRTPRAGELAWALGRFEMACERARPAEALTDVLLGLRALLEPEGPGAALLPGRLAALCALAPDRAALAERAVQALALERAVIAGTAGRSDAVDALIAELRDHLRALLRDVLCGHLDADLRTLADGLLAEEPALA